MGVRYDWADADQLIMNIYLEAPWTWKEYNETIAILMPMLRDLGRPCATVVDTSKMGALPKDGNVMRILMNVENVMPDNLFASVVVGAHHAIMVFMNALMKIRPRAGRTALFTETMDEAYTAVRKRYTELYPDGALPTKPQQYDLVADQYDISFQIVPYRLHIEAYSVFSILGDVTGKSVLDLATGTGYYARALRQRGAERVVGVDISPDMVAIAKQAEAADPLRIEYHVQDVTHFSSSAPFDIALAVYLLHYAPSKEAMAAMCQAIAGNLKKGGRFVTYQLNPEIAREPDYYGEMGLNLKLGPNKADGESLTFSVTLGGMTTPEIMAYRWEKASVNEALTKAGFTSIRWIDPQLSAAGLTQFGMDYFAKYLRQPHALLIECIKA